MGSRLAGLSPQRQRFVLGIAVLVALALVAALVGYLLSRPDDVTPVGQDELGPVLLVPGYGGSTASLTALAVALLQSEGRDATVVALAGDGTGDLREQAEVLDDAVSGRSTGPAPARSTWSATRQAV